MWTSHQVWTFHSIWGGNNGLQVHRDYSFCANVLYFLNNDKKNSY